MINFLSHLAFALLVALGVVFITAGISFNTRAAATTNKDIAYVIKVATATIALGILCAIAGWYVGPFRQPPSEPAVKPVHTT